MEVIVFERKSPRDDNTWNISSITIDLTGFAYHWWTSAINVNEITPPRSRYGYLKPSNIADNFWYFTRPRTMNFLKDVEKTLPFVIMPNEHENGGIFGA